MAESNGKTRCIDCNKDKATMKCGGCSQDFCYKHLKDHRQDLNKQLDEIETDHDVFRHSLIQQTEHPNNHTLVEQIDDWEQKSIRTVQETAEEARQILFKHTNENIYELKKRLNKLTEELHESRNEDDFNEINLHHFQEELDQLTKELNEPSNISILEETTAFISQISVQILKSNLISTIDHNTKWNVNGITVAGGNGYGNALNQLSSPCGLYVDNDQSIYIADYHNHRVMKWKRNVINGEIVAGGKGEGSQPDQLSWPTDVIVDNTNNNLIICNQGNKRIVQWLLQNGIHRQTILSNIACSSLMMTDNGDLYICNGEKDEVRRWHIGDINGTLVAGGNGRGNNLNQLNQPNFVFVDRNYSVYVSDRNNHRVMKWMDGAKEGVIVAGGQGEGNDLTQLVCPEGVIVDHLGTVYVADYNNHRVMRWYQRATQGDVVAGGHGQGEQANQLNHPTGLSFDRQGNLYVADWNNHRVQRFDIIQN